MAHCSSVGRATFAVWLACLPASSICLQGAQLSCCTAAIAAVPVDAYGRCALPLARAGAARHAR
eukprot:1608925-Prymnesium_polylepis.1